jgi:desampylase
MMAEARRAVPEEACGLLVGRRQSDAVAVTRSVRCENVAAPETRTRRFEIDPRRLIEEERALRDSSEEVVGFYHSHPEGDPVPSKVDLTYMALWPDAVWVIVGAGGTATVPARAWRLDSAAPDRAREVPIETVDAERVE